jgi:hypothetical protein
MFINKNETPIPTLTSTVYEKLALSICFAGILVIGFLSGVYSHIEKTVGL